MQTMPQYLLQEIKDGIEHCPKGLPATRWLAKSTGNDVKEDGIWSNWESRDNSLRKEGLKHFLDPDWECEDQGMGII